MDQHTEKEALLAKIAAICYQGDEVDSMESISLQEWRQMEIEELRTIVVLMEDGVLDLINVEMSIPRKPCFLIESLYRYITSNQNPRHPFTRAPLTRLQRQHITDAYMRLNPTTSLRG